MVDRCGFGAATAAAEEHHVAGLKLGKLDPLRPRSTCHLRRRPPAKRLCERHAARIALQLEDSPAKPEQSKRPRELTPKSVWAPALVPPHTYG
jgi:hypothetical protein